MFKNRVLSRMLRAGMLAASGTVMLGALSLTAMFSSASAQPLPVAPNGVARPAGTLECSTYTSGPNGGAECYGTQTWRLALYCDWPSPSPVYGATQYGDGASYASCWFGSSAQYAAIESW